MKINWLSMTLAVVIGATPSLAADAPKLNLLLLTGQCNHNWQATTPVLKEVLESTGRFAVTVTEHPEQCTAEQLAKYDVLLSNWNAWGKGAAVPGWPEATQQAVLDFVRGGKGFVVVHAGSSSMYDWAEYQQMVGASWKIGQTGHGKPHSFYVRVTDPTHPVTNGLKLFVTRDELWHRTGLQRGVKPLVVAYSAEDKGGSGKDEPLALTHAFGQGRVFTLLLGHDVQAMASAGFRSLLCRGAEWAATGEVTVPPFDQALTPAQLEFVLDQLRSYKVGDRREPLLMLEYHVGQVLGTARVAEVAQRLAALLEDAEATPDARAFACRQLAFAGGPAEVPVLAKHLVDPKLGFFARAALERIPGDEATAALRGGVEKTTGLRRVGLIQSLGRRRDPSTLEVFTTLARDPDQQTAEAALLALGELGTGAALHALLATPTVPAGLQRAHRRALLACADRVTAAGQLETAKPAWTRLLEADQPAVVRGAAFLGSLRSSPADRQVRVREALAGEDQVLARAAVRFLSQESDSALLGEVSRGLDKLPPPVQVQLLALMEQRPAAASLPVLSTAVASAEAEVRRAALRVLVARGQVDALPLLLRTANAAAADEAALAQEAIARLAGEGVEVKLLSELPRQNAAGKRVLIAALVSRSAAAAVPALLKLAETDPAIRAEAVEAIGALGRATDCKSLLALLTALPKADRPPVEEALIALCTRTEAATPVLEALKTATPGATASLLRVLGGVGTADCLPPLQAALRSKDAALRQAAVTALSGWRDAAPLADLAEVAASTDEATLRQLALRGLARLTPLATDRSPEELFAQVSPVLKAAQNAAERRLALTVLGKTPCLAALQAVEPLIQDEAVGAEAALAALSIAEKLPRQHRSEIQRLAETLSSSPQGNVKKRATALLLKVAELDNLARGAVATSPDGLEKDGTARGDGAAIDGNPDTYWDETDGQKLYILRVEFPEPETTGVLRLTGYQHHNYAPKDFEVVCDGKAVTTVKNAQYKDNVLIVTFPQTKCKALELRITGYYGKSPAIRELELFSQLPKAVK